MRAAFFIFICLFAFAAEAAIIYNLFSVWPSPRQPDAISPKMALMGKTLSTGRAFSYLIKLIACHVFHAYGCGNSPKQNNNVADLK